MVGGPVKNFPRAGITVVIFLGLLCWNPACGDEIFTEKPSYIQTCKIYQPGFTKCSTESIQKLMDALAKGIPEIEKTLGPMEPFKVGTINYKQDNNDAATLSANLTDLILSGLSKLRVKQSRVSKKDFSWETKILIPKLRLDGNYKMSGKILIIPLNGAGRMFIEMDNMDMVVRTKTRLHEKGGFTFYNVTETRVDFNMTGLKTNFDNIFNGNSKEVERSTNEFFNDNWRDFFEALRPVVYETVEKVLLSLMKATFDLMPANFLIEDIPTSKQLYGTTN